MRAGRLNGFVESPIPVLVRGITGGRSVDRTEYLPKIARGLLTKIVWPEIEREDIEEVTKLISNIGVGHPTGFVSRAVTIHRGYVRPRPFFVVATF